MLGIQGREHSAIVPRGEDKMTTSRISAVAIALSVAFGCVVCAGSTQRSAKDQNLSGTIFFQTDGGR